MDDYITGRNDTTNPASPYYIERRSSEQIKVEEQLSKCVMCCEFFDPEGEIEDGKPIYKGFPGGYMPVYWEEGICPECKNDMT